MERWVAKVIAILITFILPLTCTLIPYPMAGYIDKKGKMGQMVICRLMCYGGGIFFGTFLLHMGPETRLTMDYFLLIPEGIKYPLTDLIIGFGFFFVLLLEKIVMRINKRKVQARQRKLEKNCVLFSQANRGYVCSGCSSGKACEGLGTGNCPLENGADTTAAINSRIAMQVADIEDIKMKSINSECPLSDADGNCCCVESSAGSLPVITAMDVKPSADKVSLSSSHHDSHDELEAGHHNMRSLILIMALSLHHLFEGMSLGLQHTVTSVFTLLLALMCHETIISFSLGLQFVKCKYSLKRFIITAVAVSTIMPIGVAIGTIMTEVGAESTQMEIANGILQAFASGTFIFVTFFEILQEEIDPHDTSIGKVLCALCGYVTISLLILIPDGSTMTRCPSQTTTTVEMLSDYTTAALTTAGNNLLG